MIVTVQDLIEAAERNGYKQARGAWFRNKSGPISYGNAATEENPIISACFMGQMAINLGVSDHNLHHELNTKFDGLGSDIMTWNDSQKLRYATILELVKKRLTDAKKIRLNLVPKTYHAKRKDADK